MAIKSQQPMKEKFNNFSIRPIFNSGVEWKNIHSLTLNNFSWIPSVFSLLFNIIQNVLKFEKYVLLNLHR